MAAGDVVRRAGRAVSSRVPVALAHDYVTQRGGAERVAAIMAEAFTGAPLYTTLYDPEGTFADFEGLDIRTSVLNRLPWLRRHHRLALPLLAPAVSTMRVDADVLLASSSGWAHGIRCTGRTVVYCHAPARWLYQKDVYLGADEGPPSQRAQRFLAAATLGMVGPALRRWDAGKAKTADRYLVNSTVIRTAVAEVYGIEAEVLAPPPAMTPGGPMRRPDGVTEPFMLCVARLLPYKNVDVVIRALDRLDGLGLVVVGRGPDEQRLRALAAHNPSLRILGGASEAELRWLYANAVGLVAASYEDFGLTPLEAAGFGKPTAALRAGGYLDTIDPVVNGVFFENPDPASVADGVAALVERTWDAAAIGGHADRFGRARFIERLRGVVAEFGA